TINTWDPSGGSQTCRLDRTRRSNFGSRRGRPTEPAASARRAYGLGVDRAAFSVQEQRPFQHGLELPQVALPLLFLERGDGVALELDRVGLLPGGQPRQVVAG